jgi:serine/threonine protein kinase
VQPQPFGYYTLINRINVGGMAEVFKACYYQEDDKLAFAAIKRILPNLAQDQSFVDMFISEAQMASKLQHPGIGQIIEQGCEKGEYYIAMEYIAGKDLLYLRHHLKDKGAHFSPALSAYVIACIAEALDYAHFKTDESGQLMGLIHRDISPQNILISYDGDVKLIDFGIAKAKDRSQESTRAGVLKGKFGYMSPEQLLGKGPVNHRLDIFSLGVVFYELLTNRRLFYGESDLETLELVRAAKIEPPSLKHPWISKTLDQIILKALAKNPNERYQRAADMGVDLRRFLEAEAPNINKSQLKNWMYQEFANLIANERAQESYLIDQLKTASQDDSDSTMLNMNKFDFQLVQTPQPFANPNFQQSQAYMQQGYGGQGQF